MAPREKGRRYTQQQRAEYLEQFKRIGLSQAEFCRRAQLHPMTFSRWRRRIRTVFAEVQVSSSSPRAVAEESCMKGAAVLHLRQGAKLEVVLANEAAWGGLGRMLKILEVP